MTAACAWSAEECEKCGGLGRVEKIAKSATEEFDPERPIAGLQMIESAHIQQRKTTRGSELAADLKTSGLLPPGGG